MVSDVFLPLLPPPSLPPPGCLAASSFPGVQDVITSPFDGPSGLPLVLAHPASGGQIHPSTQARINAQGGGAASQSNPFGEPPA